MKLSFIEFIDDEHSKSTEELNIEVLRELYKLKEAKV